MRRWKPEDEDLWYDDDDDGENEDELKPTRPSWNWCNGPIWEAAVIASTAGDADDDETATVDDETTRERVIPNGSIDALDESYLDDDEIDDEISSDRLEEFEKAKEDLEFIKKALEKSLEACQPSQDVGDGEKCCPLCSADVQESRRHDGEYECTQCMWIGEEPDQQHMPRELPSVTCDACGYTTLAEPRTECEVCSAGVMYV